MSSRPEPSAAFSWTSTGPHKTVSTTRSAKQILMATVADKYPTSCTSSFWTPDRDKALRQPSEACSTVDIVRSADVCVGCESGVAGQGESWGGISLGCLDVSSTGGGDPDGAPSSTVSTGDSVEEVNETPPRTLCLIGFYFISNGADALFHFRVEYIEHYL